MPRSIEAEKHLAQAREALAADAPAHAVDCAWRAAAAAAQIGDEKILREVIEIASALAAAGADDTEQLSRYAAACLEDAQAGTRPPSAFERLFARGRRRR
jgi:hypothetical protein